MEHFLPKGSRLMRGKIIKGIGGFYYVQTKSAGLVECKAKGVFRKQKKKPLVGDDVEIMLLPEEVQTSGMAAGNMTEIYERRNRLIRPAVANVDQAVVIFAVSYPKPNLNLLDRFLLMMRFQGVPVVICFNKTDELAQEEMAVLAQKYSGCGCALFFTSTKDGNGLEAFARRLHGRTSVLAGPSGVGKSSLMQALFPDVLVEIGEMSRKIRRGKHTTRHSELFYLEEDTYVMDTPGFTSLELPDMEKEELKEYYEEFAPFTDCRFLSCVHINEPDCRVKEAVEAGKISLERYQNYKSFYEELRIRRKY